jgi:endonuclease/exonuclease/phosphatase family metal-dependent hydrolase
MRRSTKLVTFLVIVILLVVGCSSDDETESTTGPTTTEVTTTTAEAVTTEATESPPETDVPASVASDLRIVTFNAGLAEGFVPLAAERQPLVAQAIADLDAEIVFLQEVWTPDAVNEIRAATSAVFPTAIFPEPIPEADGGIPACTLDELADLDSCISTNCADASPDELVGCVLSNCGVPFAGLGDVCRNCITANVGGTVAEAVESCTTAAAAYAYEGSVGIGLLTTLDVLDSDVLVLESSINRRAVLHALVDIDGPAPLHVFGTHLSAVFSDIPYPGDGSWEAEQAAQINALLAYIDTRTEAGDPIVVLGDFNTGPAGEGFEADVVDNYELLTSAMLTSPFIDSENAACTFCADNPLVDTGADGGASVAIDHVFIRDLEAGAESSRILDQPLTLDADGESVTTALSDHYGVVLTLTDTR